MRTYYKKYMSGTGHGGKEMGRMMLTDMPQHQRGYRRKLRAALRGLKSAKYLKEAEIYGDSKLLSVARRLDMKLWYDSPLGKQAHSFMGHYEKD